MDALLPAARAVAEKLKARGETVAVCESSAGGLVSAALLAVPGASAYFLGGAVVYTRASREGLLGITEADMAGHAQFLRTLRPAAGAYRARASSAPIGALPRPAPPGPRATATATRRGMRAWPSAGAVERVITLETGAPGREANMRAFAAALFRLAGEALD